MKLVRDLIPAIIQADGKSPVCRVALQEEKLPLLLNKLQEEVSEFKESPSPEEMADILEVLEALSDHLGWEAGMIARVKAGKKQERGGFAQFLILESVGPDTDRA